MKKKSFCFLGEDWKPVLGCEKSIPVHNLNQSEFILDNQVFS